MPFELRDCSFFGPALPEPFVKFQLEGELRKRKLLATVTGPKGKSFKENWEIYRRKLRMLGEQGGDRRVANHVLEPLVDLLGYSQFEKEQEVITREGPEDGGWLFSTKDGRGLRAWTVGLGTDLDAPNRRGRAYRFSPGRMAERVLLAKSERVGLLSDGEELRLIICDPARPDSHISIRLDRSGGWRSARNIPDSFKLLVALASPNGVAAMPDITDAARLSQSAVTKKLRLQARSAIEGFLQELLSHPKNAAKLSEKSDTNELSSQLWREGLILVYRLLFVFKLESSSDPARAFSFAATSLWRNTYSPNTALAPLVRKVLDHGIDTGNFLENGLRTLWRIFVEGMSSSELEVKPLGGALFGAGTTPLLDDLHWGEQAVARLLDALLWTPGDGKTERERVHYGALDVEDLGRVYEALLELEPGITTEPMCRLRRAKLEVVVPLVQGEPYRKTKGKSVPLADDDDDDDDDDSGSSKKKGGKTSVLFIEEIPQGKFFLRVGLGRKASGSYYTPHPFVRFLVQETLTPQLEEKSPRTDPQPEKILALKVLDPAMGSGHFLVEACRFLGEALYEACRLCDELAVQAEDDAAKAMEESERDALNNRALDLRRRVEVLPDPNDELVAYLPSRATEGEVSGLSQKKAEALCRRLVAVHCLYGVDKNPLAVELAKLSLWLESYAEGMPLTFMDHRLIQGDSLTGPFFEHLLTYPKSGEKLDDLFAQGLTDRLKSALSEAQGFVHDLEASVGKDAADLEQKKSAKEKLDEALEPLKLLAAAWSGGVMMGDECDDPGYQLLANAVVQGIDGEVALADRQRLQEMVEVGMESVSYDLTFPEVFFSAQTEQNGFDVVIGNPPWDTVRPLTKEFFASFDLRILNAPTKRERDSVQQSLETNETIAVLYNHYLRTTVGGRNTCDRIYNHQRVRVNGKLTGGDPDLAKYFSERAYMVTCNNGSVGFVVPGAIHSASGATGIRRLFVHKTNWEVLYSFNNALSLFEVETKVKFSLFVVRKGRNTKSIRCRFRQKSTSKLFQRNEDLLYTPDFIQSTGGEYLAFLELEDRASAEAANAIFNTTDEMLLSFCANHGIRFGSECHSTNDSWRFESTEGIDTDARDPITLSSLLKDNLYIVANEDSIHQYDDHWTDSPRYMVPLSKLYDKTDWIKAGGFYRICYRRIANIVDLRSMKATVVPPGWISTSPFMNRTPWSSRTASQLLVTAILNTFSLDWILRLRLSATLNKFIVDALPIPNLIEQIVLFLVHSALRLTCNHSGYANLWIDQVGNEWREPGLKHSWPAIHGDDTRWSVKACIDAVVADAYGLNREQYVHILSTFSHKSYPSAPTLCLEAFDELKSIGLEAFTKKHDPYWDIPLNENLPKPVIELSVPKDEKKSESGLGPLFDNALRKK